MHSEKSKVVVKVLIVKVSGGLVDFHFTALV